MPDYELNGIALHIPDELLTARLREFLENGRYEHKEILAVGQHVAAGDRVLELGAGAGYVTTMLAKLAGAENVLCVEANPAMRDVIEGNLKRNDVAGVTLMLGAVVPDEYDEATIPFHIPAGFWAASLAVRHVQKDPIDVPVLKFGALLKRHRPDVVVMDIEGGEEFLFDRTWPDHVRLVILELHPSRYADIAVQRMFDCMSHSGLAYSAWGSHSNVVVFKRIEG